MSFAGETSPDRYEDGPYSGCRSLSPIRSEFTLTSNDQRLNTKGHSQQNMTALLNKFIQKDKENEHARKENQELKDKLKEFEYLIIKGSEEVKRKQSEINTLNTIIDKLKQTIPDAVSVDNLQRQLDESQRELHRIKSESAQTQTRLRVELQKEREQNNSLSKQAAETKFKLDDMFKESRGSIDDLQKNFTMTSQKYINLEKDYTEARTLVKELSTDVEVKNQTLDHAHQVISRLKLEVEGLVENNENTQKKVKEYKGKCKSLKKMNETQKLQMKELEERLSDYEDLKDELAQSREDLQELMRARMEDRFKLDEKSASKVQENETLQKTVVELKNKIMNLEKEYNEASIQFCETQVKYDHVSASLLERDKEVIRLQEELNKEEERFTKELQTFKKQALRSFQALNLGPQDALPPLHSRNASPLKYGARTMEGRRPLSEVNENLVGNTVGATVRRGIIETPQDKRNSSFRRTTPIKMYNSKGEFELDPRQPVRENNELTFSYADRMLNSINETRVAHREEKFNESLFEGIENSLKVEDDKTILKEGELKENLTVEILKEELQRSMEREEYFILIIETLYSKAEFEVKEFLDKLNSQPLVNPELESWRMRSEEFEQKYHDIFTKYKEASDIILQLIDNNKVLSENLDYLQKGYNKLITERKDESGQFVLGQQHSQKVQTGLVQELKALLDILSQGNILTETGQLRSFEALQKITHECEKYQNQFKVLEQLIEGHNGPLESENSQHSLREISNIVEVSADKRMDQQNKSKHEGLNISRSESPVLFKLKRKLENSEFKVRQLQEEKNELNKMLRGLTEEVRDWKEAAGMIDNEYQKTIDEKEHVIRKKDELLKRREDLLKNTEESLQKTELLLIEKEELSLRQNEELNELLGRDMSFNAVLEEKSESIRELTRQKHELCQRLDEINQFSVTVKKELAEKTRDLNHKNGLLNALRADMLLKDQDLDVKEHEIQDKFEEIYRLEKAVSFREQELSHLRSENNNLRTQVIDFKEQSLRGEHGYGMPPIGRMSHNETAYHTPGNKTYNRGNEKWDSNLNGLSGMRGERFSVPTMRRGETRPRSSSGRPEGQAEFNDDDDVSIRMLKEKNVLLTIENKELFEKLNKLNELISYNKTLEQEIGILKANNVSRSGLFDTSSKVYLDTEAGRTQTETECFDMGYIEKCLQLPDDYKRDKEVLKHLRENIKDETTVQFVEKYKAKTKKVFQKRVKELEMLLRFIDQKSKGYNFDRLTYTICSIQDEAEIADDKKTYSKLNYLVEGMLEKNGNLKGFVESMAKRIEDLYIRNYNLNILLGSFIKTSTINGLESRDQDFFEQLGSVPEFEDLSKLDIPELISHFNEMEVVNQSANSNNAKFFKVLTTVKPSINILLNYLSKNPAQNNLGKLTSFSFSAKAEDYITAKSDKLKEVETLYLKLIEIINKNDKTQNSLPDYVKGYIQTYNNIYATVMNEAQSVITFATNLVNGCGVSQLSEGPPDVSGNFEGDNTQTNSKLSAFHGVSQSVSLSAGKTMLKEEKNSSNLRDTRSQFVLNNRSVNISGNSSPERIRFYSKSNTYTPTKQEKNENDQLDIWVQSSRI